MDRAYVWCLLLPLDSVRCHASSCHSGRQPVHSQDARLVQTVDTLPAGLSAWGSSALIQALPDSGCGWSHMISHCFLATHRMSQTGAFRTGPCVQLQSINQSITHFQRCAGCVQGVFGFCLSMNPYPELPVTRCVQLHVPPILAALVLTATVRRRSMDADDLLAWESMAASGQLPHARGPASPPVSPRAVLHSLGVTSRGCWGSPTPPLSPRGRLASCSLASSGFHSSPRIKPRA